MLDSFESGMRAAVFGASGGVGRALVAALAQAPNIGHVYAISRSPMTVPPGPTTALRASYDAPETIASAVETMAADGPLHLVIVATGILHEPAGATEGGVSPEKDWRHLEAGTMARVFHINTIGPALVAGAVLDQMPKSGRSVFAALSARVGSISDNRIGGWYSYRASKAALNMIIRGLAIEVERKRRETVCIGLHPGTVDTALSEPFQSSTKPGQVVAPETAAHNLLSVIDGVSRNSSGRLFAWDGQEIAP